MIQFNSTGVTDTGLRRTNNEDAFLVMPERNVVAVADGMGGAAAGEIASDLFVKSLRDTFSQRSPETLDDLLFMIQETYRLANNRMRDHVAGNPGDDGMGCTAELLAFFDNRYVIGHVGDSRIYLLRGGELRQLTKDHSHVQSLVDQGVLTAEEARNHPRKNIILRALGMDANLSLDILKGRVQPDDIFLLCSDGLSDMLDDPGIRSVLSMNASLPEKATALIEGAKAAGGRDNITAVLCQVVFS